MQLTSRELFPAFARAALRAKTAGSDRPSPASDPTFRKARRSRPSQVRERAGRKSSMAGCLRAKAGTKSVAGMIVYQGSGVHGKPERKKDSGFRAFPGSAKIRSD